MVHQGSVVICQMDVSRFFQKGRVKSCATSMHGAALISFTALAAVGADATALLLLLLGLAAQRCLYIAVHCKRQQDPYLIRMLPHQE